MGKLLGVTQLQMYEKMITEEFQPIINALEARGNDIRQDVVQRVKKQFGIYKLEAKISAAKIQLNELEDEKQNLMGHPSYNANVDFHSTSIIGKEITRIMENLNSPLKETRRIQSNVIKNLRLSGIGEDVQKVFTDLETTIEDLTYKLKALPPITVEKITKKR